MNALADLNPTVVLVHGAWADASSWQKVIPFLHRAGVRVVAVQNPTSSLVDDVAATRNALENIPGPVVLAGHSWGGTVITEAGNDPKVKGLVFVAAFAPNVGESTGDQVAAYSAPPGLSTVSANPDGSLVMSVDGFLQNVAQDLPEEEVRVLAAVSPPLGSSTFGDKVTQTAWSTRENWYVVSLEDRAVNVELQQQLALHLKARKTELKASHMSLLSHPEAVAGVILDAVDAVARRTSEV